MSIRWTLYTKQIGGKRMDTKRWKRILCIIAIGCMLFSSVFSVSAAETFETIGNVKPSKEAYVVDIGGGYNNFLRNMKPVDMSVGKRYYMTYTVEEVTSNALTQNGIAITQDKSLEYPYVKGMLHYNFSTDMLLEPGCTYFYRFEVTETGLDYIVAKVNEKESSWLEFSLTEKNTNENCQYFGIWFGGNPDARVRTKLSAVLCYDEQGNDLGLDVGGLGATTVYQTKGMVTRDIGHYYEFSLKNAPYVAISNARPTDSKVIYIAYTVENVEKNNATQAGVSYNKAPTKQYPHSAGLLNYRLLGEGVGSPLVREGAEYLIRVEVLEDTIRTLVKETYKGVESFYAMPTYYGTMYQDAEYVSWWYGDGGSAQLTADFKNFRIYDDKGKNLGVQLNSFSKNVDIKHFGNLEDYTYCEAVYYCKDNNTLAILDDECKAGMLLDEEGQKTQWGTYTVRGTSLTMTIDRKEKIYEYHYAYMTDPEGYRYERLGDKTITFETGIKGHASNRVVDVTAETGYKIEKPEDPVVEGFTFDGWCLRDGTLYDFSKIVTESVTLYARYSDGAGHEYLAVDNIIEEPEDKGNAEWIVIATSSVLLVMLTSVGIVLISKKGRKKSE